MRLDQIDDSEPGERPGGSSERGAGAGAVLVHARYQRVDIVELQFLADKADEGDVEHRSIEIAAEIEQKNFEQRRAIVEGGAAAEAGDPVEARLMLAFVVAVILAWPSADPHGVNAMLEPAVVVETDVGGGIAEIAAAFLAMNHLAGDEPWSAQHRGR